MTNDRDWRKAKIPQWVKDAVTDESNALRLTAALTWPQEARPTPVPFHWGGYDALSGEPYEGLFWNSDGAVHIRKSLPEQRAYSRWQFSSDGKRWADTKRRGPLFLTERDAKLNNLWDACTRCAGQLAVLRSKL